MYKFTSLFWFHSLISFKVPHIKKCNKANGLISFYILISFNSPTYSTVSQIQLYYILSRSYLIQQSQHIQQCNKFNSLIWFNSLISCNSPTYPKVQQSQWSYLVYILISLNIPTHSTVSHIQQCHKFNCLISFTFSSISIVYKFTSLFWFHSLISFNSPKYSKVQQIQYYNLVYIISDSTVPYIQQSHKFSFII